MTTTSPDRITVNMEALRLVLMKLEHRPEIALEMVASSTGVFVAVEFWVWPTGWPPLRQELPMKMWIAARNWEVFEDDEAGLKEATHRLNTAFGLMGATPLFPLRMMEPMQTLYTVPS